jgi:cytosine/adenosine deaminase-related metal-dependent hydrolase
MADTVVIGAEAIFTGRSAVDERIGGDIRIRDGRIVALGTVGSEPGDHVIDARGCVVTPGLVNTHHHLFQSVLKGVAAGIDCELEAWLESVPYTYWDRVDAEAMEVAAQLGMVELLLSGCTTVSDHHYIYDASRGFDAAHVLFETADRLGMRFVLARGGASQGRKFTKDDPRVPMPLEDIDTMLAATQDLAARYHDPAPDAMRRLAFAPTTPFWSIPESTLRPVAEATRQMGLRLHSHLSETRNYNDYCTATYGCRPVEFVAERGWVGEDVWFAHLVHVDDDELRILADTGTGMSHCPQSNGRLGSGIAPADRFARMGGKVSLAVDGAASNEAADMANEMHVAWMTHRAAKGPQAVRCEDVMRWATAGGAQVLGLPAIGTIAPGQAADIAVFDLNHPRYAGLHDPLIAPVASGGAAKMRHVLVNGRTVVENGAIPGLDLPRLVSRTRDVVRRIAQ